MTHAQIGRLTDRQIVDHYFHPRDEQGRLILGGEASFDAESDEPQEARRARLREMASRCGAEIVGG